MGTTTIERVLFAPTFAVMCPWYFFLFLFFKILFIYLTERDTAREETQAGGGGEGEAGFPRIREPDVGLDPRTLGSRPEPKADA